MTICNKCKYEWKYKGKLYWAACTRCRKLVKINSINEEIKEKSPTADLEDELDDKNLLMIGIYHSHPNYPARPSKYDLEHAWPNLSYMVVSVDDGKSTKLTSWRLDSSNKEFVQEKITET